MLSTNVTPYYIYFTLMTSCSESLL